MLQLVKMLEQASHSSKSPLLPSRSPLLKPQSEQIIDIRETELPEIVSDDEIRASRNHYNMTCDYCQRRCSSRAGKLMHERAHKRELRREISSKRGKHSGIYTCRVCEEQFNQRRKLNEHVKTHAKLIECTFCRKKFAGLVEFDLQHAINNGKKHFDSSDSSHRTRSQSRLSCHKYVLKSEYDPHLQSSLLTPVSLSDSEFKRRAGSAQSVTPHFPKLRKRTDSAYSVLSHSAKSRRRVGSALSTVSYSTKHSNSIENWIINKRYRRDDYIDSIRPFSRNTSPAASVWSSRTGETMRRFFLCSADDCLSSYECLNECTMHEMIEHKMIPLFQCKECRRRFNTRSNLLQHRIIEHPDMILCVLCNKAQHGTAAIQEHFERQRKFSSNCEICGKLFLARCMLEEHMQNGDCYLQHKEKKRTILIRIDRVNKKFKECEDIKIDMNPYEIEFSNLSFHLTHRHNETINKNLIDNIYFNNLIDELPWRN